MKRNTTYELSPISSDSPEFVARINTHAVTECCNGRILRVWRGTLAEMMALRSAASERIKADREFARAFTPNKYGEYA